jgi:hypothetical protein
MHGNLFCKKASKWVAELRHPPSGLTERRGAGGWVAAVFCPCRDVARYVSAGGIGDEGGTLQASYVSTTASPRIR